MHQFKFYKFIQKHIFAFKVYCQWKKLLGLIHNISYYTGHNIW